MRTRTRLSAALLVTATLAFAAAPLGQKIHRVENGLLRAVAIKAQPAQKFSVTDRLKHYRVPGVSVAVVSDGKLE